MTVMPTVEGGLKLIPEEDYDWNVLSAIALDAHEDLAKRFGGMMDEESMWDDIVVPDLELHFGSQLEEVIRALKAGRKEGEVIISPETSEAWYGALNQARLGLERIYHFGPDEKVVMEELSSGDEKEAYRRGRFYSAVQAVLIEYVMPD